MGLDPLPVHGNYRGYYSKRTRKNRDARLPDERVELIAAFARTHFARSAYETPSDDITSATILEKSELSHQGKSAKRRKMSRRKQETLSAEPTAAIAALVKPKVTDIRILDIGCNSGKITVELGMSN